MSDIAVLEYEGRPVRRDGEFMSLTDMWKAEGSPRNKRPVDWLRRDGKEFVEFIGENLKVAHGHFECIRIVRGGDDAGTSGHWQIALAYAKYLSAKFHAWCNSIVREHMARLVSEPTEALVHQIRVLQARIDALDPFGPGVIGKTRALYILDAIRHAARIACAISGDQSGQTYRRECKERENQLRMHVGFPASHGQRIENMPMPRFGDAHAKALEILAREQARQGRVVKELRARTKQVELPI